MKSTKPVVKCTPKFLDNVNSMTAASKATPWLMYAGKSADDLFAVGVYASRGDARKAKTVDGRIVKVSDVKLTVVNPLQAKPKALPMTHESTIESPCFVVWDTADKMHARAGGARRKDVLAACIAKGVAYYTARTQYQLWYASTKASKKSK